MKIKVKDNVEKEENCERRRGKRAAALDGKHKSCLNLTGSKGGVCRTICCGPVTTTLL
jgi:hypothetical protein